MTKEKQRISIFDECFSQHFLVKIFKHTEKLNEFYSNHCQMTKLKQSSNEFDVFGSRGKQSTKWGSTGPHQQWRTLLWGFWARVSFTEC